MSEKRPTLTVTIGCPGPFWRSVGWAVECGATLAEQQPQESVRVMLDPQGHPFCLFL